MKQIGFVAGLQEFDRKAAQAASKRQHFVALGYGVPQQAQLLVKRLRDRIVVPPRLSLDPDVAALQRAGLDEVFAEAARLDAVRGDASYDFG